MSPPHWPTSIKYIQHSQFHSSVPKNVRLDIQGTSTRSAQAARPPVVIRRIMTLTHPAYGEIHCDDRPNSDYDLSLYRSQDGTNVGIDASSIGNEARFINDYRGIMPKPNAIFSDVETGSGEKRMSIWSSGQEIKKGDEILVSYGKAWWRAREPVD
ncbi:hypothetical protein H0H93_012037 [Arthromyces matolae]|nr:hypothetical protein H0H93_012037 [Arthromyces matolae]